VSCGPKASSVVKASRAIQSKAKKAQIADDISSAVLESAIQSKRARTTASKVSEAAPRNIEF